jgi:hypothetical protein
MCLIDDTMSIIDDTMIMIDDTMSIIDDTMSMIDDSTSVIGGCKIHSKLWQHSLITLGALFTIVIVL